MPSDQTRALRRARGDMSWRTFAQHLADNGLRLSRHRLADVERGTITLPAPLWDEIAQALIRGGRTPADVADLRSAARPIEPAPPPTAGQRLEQWHRIVGHVRHNRWWRSPVTLVARVTDPKHLSRNHQILAQSGVERMRYLRDVRTRLDLGMAQAGNWQADPHDRIAIDRKRSLLSIDVDRVELFLLRLRLHNTGTVPWRDRLLYRVGPPVTSTTPFTPGVLPVPDTDPSQSCEILMPGRAQWLCSLAAINYVMVFPDGTSSLPGRVTCWIDTRGAGVDHSLPLPPGFPVASPKDGTQPCAGD